MPIVEELIEEVREACAVKAEQYGCPSNGAAIRGSAGALSATIVRAGLDAIRKYFKDYEEVEVWTGKGVADMWLTFRAPSGPQDGYNIPVGPILIPKLAPEMLTVSRETLAVLAEHYEKTPAKDAACDAALTEAKEAL